MTHPDTLCHSAEGNTKSPALSDQFDINGLFDTFDTAIPKKDSLSRGWCMTLNNWKESEYTRICKYFSEKKYYIVGKEVGDLCGTPHLQGYFYATNSVRFSTLKRLAPRANWRMARGSALKNRDYCSKEGDYVSNIPLSREEKIARELTKMVLRPWQQHVADLIAEEIAEASDHRTIHWFWEANGNTGKSYLNWYLNAKYNPIMASGKAADIFNQIKTWFDDADIGAEPELCIVDVPRTFGVEYVSYLALEKVKDRLIYSGKYEGGRLCWVRPTCVVCFANEPPVRSKMSTDRWNVVNIGDIGIPITDDSGYDSDEESLVGGYEHSPI